MKESMRWQVLTLIPCALALVAGCATAPRPGVTSRAPAAPWISSGSPGVYRTADQLALPATRDELGVVASARTLLGKPPNAVVVVNGRTFVLDCIGTVSAVYYGIDIDITKDFSKYAGNGVKRFFLTLEARAVLHGDRYPRPGDAIIWDNTWDANGNGDRTDDPLTHAGIVLSVDPDGTISYVHENLYRGVMIESMNLLRPGVARDENGKVLNSGLAIPTVAGGPRPVRWLSGDVFRTFGDVLREKAYFLRAGVPELSTWWPRSGDSGRFAPWNGARVTSWSRTRPWPASS